MVATVTEDSHYLYLTADDVNTVRYGMAGLLTDPSDTADDYDVQLLFEPDCALADIEVNFAPIAPTSAAGSCEARLLAIPSPADAHFRIAPLLTEERLNVKVNSNYIRPAFPPYPATVVVWQFLIFVDGFEAGLPSEWDSVVP